MAPHFSIQQLSILALSPFLVLPATAQSGQLASLLPPILSDVPGALASAGPALINSWVASIVSAHPTAVFSDLSSILATETPAIAAFLNTIFDDAEAAAQAAGAVASPLPTGVAAQISAFVNAEAGAVISDFDILVGQIPATVPIQALPSIISSDISLVESAIPIVLAAQASQLASGAGAVANTTTTATSTSTAGAGGNKASAGSSAPASTSANKTISSPTVSAPTSTFTGAADKVGVFGVEILAVLGLVGVVALL